MKYIISVCTIFAAIFAGTISTYATTIDITGVLFADIDGDYSFGDSPDETWGTPYMFANAGGANTGAIMYINLVAVAQGSVIASNQINASIPAAGWSFGITRGIPVTAATYDLIVTTNSTSTGVAMPAGWRLFAPGPLNGNPVLGRYRFSIPADAAGNTVFSFVGQNFGLAETIPPTISYKILGSSLTGTNMAGFTFSGTTYQIQVISSELLSVGFSPSNMTITNGVVTNSIVNAAGTGMIFEITPNPNFVGTMDLVFSTGTIQDRVWNPNNEIKLKLRADSAPPTSITLSQSGQVVGWNIVFSGISEPNGYVTVYNGMWAAVCTTAVSSTGQWSCSIAGSYPNGITTFSVVGYDPYRNGTTPVGFSVEVDNSPPSLVVQYPINGSTLTGGVMQIQAGNTYVLRTLWDASESLRPFSGANIVFSGATIVGVGQIANTSTGYYIDIRVPAMYNGAVSYKVLSGAIMDIVGTKNTTTVSGTFNIDTLAPPVPRIAINGYAGKGIPALSGTGEPNAILVITDTTGAPVCTATVRPNGTWSCISSTAFPDGNVEMIVNIFDMWGNMNSGTASSRQTVRVDINAPVTIVQGTPLASIAGKVCPGYTRVYTEDRILFKDTANNWARDYIFALAMHKIWNPDISGGALRDNMGIVNNVEKYRPDDLVTRAEYIKMVSRALACDYQFMGTRVPFTDVTPDKWYAEYVAFGISRTWIGTTKPTFSPNNYIKRNEASQIMAMALRLTYAKDPVTGVYPSPTGMYFYDVPETDPYAQYIFALAKATVVNGQTINGELRYRPTENLTRAEMAKILARAFGVPTPNATTGGVTGGGTGIL